ncbi:EF-hand calcium-binding domain-containing protein 6 isoform X2 [Brienomyrus brachyistius]|uniref:EF-hand calcium-binding domain-containing protein 6 isoform X2 n=1 Tax=Brienomyrus brachyistius TaxID=42636 RepID=UPI0020B315CF|nr:EF-hand calcium-binding domain-containing protein 6 isoform X2 [Brienomyrus brachyistius]
MLGMDSESQGNIGAESAKLALNQSIVNQEKTGQRKATDPWTAESKDDRFQDLTLEEMQTTFQEKISANSNVVRQTLQTLDATHSGSVSVKDPKVLLCNFLFPTSDETVLALVSRESLVQELPVRPSTTSSLPKLKEHVASDQGNQKKGSVARVTYRDEEEPAGNARTTYLHNRRNVLEENLIHTLAEALGFRDGTAPHSECMANLKDSAAGKTDAAARCVGTNTDPVGFLTAEECFSQMKERIKAFHGDVFTAFRVMDKNRDGVISRQGFRNLHDSLMFVTKETEYSRLLDLLGLRPGATLNFAEFNSLVQAGASTAALPHPATRPKRETCDQVLGYLAWKARCGWPDMAKVLCRFIQNGQSIILKQDLKRLLYTYAMPFTPNEFDQLWLRYDEGGRGYIREAEFLEKMGVGPRKAGRGPERPSPGECADEGPRGGSACPSAQALHTRVALHELRMAMRHSDGDHGPALVRQGEGKVEELLVPAQEHGCRGEDAQLGQQLNRMEIHLDDGPLSCMDATSMIDGGAAAESSRRQETPAATENAKGPSLENTMFRLRELVTAAYEALHKAFSALDKSRRGNIQPWVFRRILDHFCFRLTDQQFDHLMGRLMVDKWDGTVSWTAFLHIFLLNGHEAAPARSEDVGKAVRRGARPLPASDILGQIRKVVSSRLHAVAKDMADLDRAGSGVISKDDFRAICDRRFRRLMSEQFQNLWNRLPVNSLGNLEYCEFLGSFGGGEIEGPRSNGGVAVTGPSTRGITSTAPGFRQRPKCTSSSIRSSKPAEQTGRLCSSRERSTPLANCEWAKCNLRSQMHASWREIHRRCREVDREQLGEVSMEQFKAIMEEPQLKSTPLEIQQLASEGGVLNGGMVSYPEFLRHFIVTPKAQSKPTFRRPQLHVSQTPMHPGVLSRQCVDAMLRMQGPIQQFWRGMRRNFVTLDRNRSGSISLQDFRKVLSRYGIDLSEEEFFHLCSFFDKNISGQIFYNDFLCTFLK